MSRPPRGFPLPAPARWLLLGVLVFGVLAMHHVPAPHGGGMGGGGMGSGGMDGGGMGGGEIGSGEIAGMLGLPVVSAVPVAHSATDAPAVAVAPVPVASTFAEPIAAAPSGSDGGHAMLHVCLAVLLAAAGLVLAAAWLRRRREGVVPDPVERGSAGFARAPPSRTGRALLTASCVLRI
ncbi:hypothetical protein AB0F91_24410 [Amycolatopsis sp. NPDC023774]|uniref:hypothetical protein n=1 Tax=Amycolatopsis sp. NPDC023774 TaxID=3155015 RepID=UPI0033ED2D03